MTRRPTLENRWSADRDVGDDLDGLVYLSRLLGAEPGLVLRGGGNTSLKRVETDYRARQVDVLRIKGSGCDLRAARRADFPGVRLEDALPLFDRDDLSDEEMVAYLAHGLMEPDSRRPSIETLLHAFIPARCVAHSHADAILSLTNTTNPIELIADALGNRVLVIPYRRPGFRLSQEVGRAVRAQPEARGLILLNHGLVTWGETLEETYRSHLDLVTDAERFLAERSRGRGMFVAASELQLDPDARRRRAAEIAPIIRGALGRDQSVIAHFTDTPDVLAFVGSVRAREVSAAGAATPDHLLSTKNQPLWFDAVSSSDNIPGGFTAALESYRAAYLAFVGRYRRDEPILAGTPRVVLVPGVGMWTLGRDAKAERLTREVYLHTVAIMAGAEAVSRYRSLSEPEAFRAEYWPLELYKLTLARSERQLAGRVALVTGAARGIGKKVALRLAREGAHVVVTDLDVVQAESVAQAINASEGEGTALALCLDVTKEPDVEAAFERAVLAYGGIDILVSNAGIAHCAPLDQLTLADWERSFAVNATGHFLVARAAYRVFQRQGLGGSVVFVGTKNIVAPGKDFGAYSAPKAAEAQLARVLAIEAGPIGVRVNLVNPDAVFEESQLWSPALREERARSYGIAPDALEEHYRQRTLLGRRVDGDDVAEAVLFLASDRSAKTTGCMLSVDGGVREAFPR